MADELISFPATLAVLEELAEDVKAGYIGTLERNGHPTKYGTDRLSDTITTEVSVEGHTFTASLNMNEYWKYLEYGTKAHWPPRDAILKWVNIKPILPTPDRNGRIPTPETLAFLISRAIAGQSPNQANLKNPQGGTTGTHGFQKTREAILPMYYDRLGEALSEDIGNYLRLVFTW